MSRTPVYGNFGPGAWGDLNESHGPRRSLPPPVRTGIEYVAREVRGESVGVLLDELGDGCTNPEHYALFTPLRLTGLALTPHDCATIRREIAAALGRGEE